jgi:hypothetical protein
MVLTGKLESQSCLVARLRDAHDILDTDHDALARSLDALDLALHGVGIRRDDLYESRFPCDNAHDFVPYAWR